MRKLFAVGVVLTGILVLGISFAQADEAIGNGSSVVSTQPIVAAAPMVKAKKGKKTKKTAKAETKKAVWVCPMGDYTSDKPGKCPNCGMDLVEKK